MVEVVDNVLALIIASFTLGWNVLRDVVNRNRVRVTGMIGVLAGPGDKVAGPEHILIVAVNCGPFTNTLSGLCLKKSKLGKKTEHAFTFADWENRISAQFPHTFKVGEQAQYIFPFNKNCFLKKAPTKIGIWDVYGRTHWLKRKTVKIMVSRWKEKFQES